jgi:murein L,D-transpeptidase YafK
VITFARKLLARILHARRKTWLAAVLGGGLSLVAAAGLTDGPNTPLPMDADRILVDKSERVLYLLADGAILRKMDISLGLVPEGHKAHEGDFRTPEGVYYIEAKNPSSEYFLSLKISYPNAADRSSAASRGVNPGGQIMIHGLPNEPSYSDSSYLGRDWTNGCIAVSNSDMINLSRA